MEAASFFDAFVLLVSGELVDADHIDIYCIQIVFIPIAVVSFLSELAPSLLSLQVCELKSQFVISFLEHSCAFYEHIAACFFVRSLLPLSEGCGNGIFQEYSFLHGLM